MGNYVHTARRLIPALTAAAVACLALPAGCMSTRHQVDESMGPAAGPPRLVLRNIGDCVVVFGMVEWTATGLDVSPRRLSPGQWESIPYRPGEDLLVWRIDEKPTEARRWTLRDTADAADTNTRPVRDNVDSLLMIEYPKPVHTAAPHEEHPS